MKRRILMLLCLVCTVCAMAGDKLREYNKIVIELVDGTKHEIDIDGKSYIYSCIEGDGAEAVQVVEVKGANTLMKFNRDEIKTLKCIEDVTGIDEVKPDNGFINKLRYEDGKIKCLGSLAGEDLRIYDATGRLVYVAKIAGESYVGIEHLHPGAYVAKTKDYSIKVMVK